MFRFKNVDILISIKMMEIQNLEFKKKLYKLQVFQSELISNLVCKIYITGKYIFDVYLIPTI